MPISAGDRLGPYQILAPLGRGGMESKVAAAELAAGAGIPTVIAGESPLQELLAQGGTRFAAADGAPAFKLWLRHGKRVAGRIVVDERAGRASWFAKVYGTC